MEKTVNKSALHKVSIYYTKADDRYAAAHYDLVTDIMISAFGHTLYVTCIDAISDREHTYKYDVEHLISIIIDDRLFEMEDVK